MPDPALLAVLQHFANSPPSIVQPSRIVDAEPFISALEALEDERDREFRGWLGTSDAVQERMRLAVSRHPHDFPPAMFDDLISRFTLFAEWGATNLARLERLRRRQPASDRLRAVHDRTISRDRRRLAAVDDLVLVLRAMRAEADPDSRGGPVFDDPEALERYILGAVA